MEDFKRSSVLAKARETDAEVAFQTPPIIITLHVLQVLGLMI